MGLAARRLAPQADLLGRKWRSPSAEHTVQDGGRLIYIEGVEFLHNIGKLKVLFQIWLLVVGLVALGAPDQAGLFGPGLTNAASAEIVLTRKLDGLDEHMQANGTDQLLLEAILPILRHLHLADVPYWLIAWYVFYFIFLTAILNKNKYLLPKIYIYISQRLFYETRIY